jgi:hypothetical protein
VNEWHGGKFSCAAREFRAKRAAQNLSKEEGIFVRVLFFGFAGGLCGFFISPTLGAGYYGASLDQFPGQMTSVIRGDCLRRDFSVRVLAGRQRDEASGSEVSLRLTDLGTYFIAVGDGRSGKSWERSGQWHARPDGSVVLDDWASLRPYLERGALVVRLTGRRLQWQKIKADLRVAWENLERNTIRLICSA